MRPFTDSSARGSASGRKQEYFPLEDRDHAAERGYEPADDEQEVVSRPRKPSREKNTLILACCAIFCLALGYDAGSCRSWPNGPLLTLVGPFSLP